MRKLTQEEFILRSVQIHGQKYDYSKTKYINRRSKVIIICRDHGEFLQQAGSHLQGFGCKQCDIQIRSKPIEKFIQNARDVHGDKYDYSKAIYINSLIKIKITCPLHGEFLQIPINHLQGCGCPVCNESKGERSIREYLQSNNINFMHQKTFDNCKYNKLLRFDFYLPDFTLCIEYDGVGHYKPINFNGCSDIDAQKALEDIQITDKIKNQYCIDNKINLLRIPYIKFNSISYIIDKKLKDIKNE